MGLMISLSIFFDLVWSLELLKVKGLILCNELKIQAKYGPKKAQSRKDKGTLYEGFGIIKIEAPSSKAKWAKKAISERFKRTN